MTTFQPLGEGVYRVTGAMPRSAVTGRFITNQDDPLTPDECTPTMDDVRATYVDTQTGGEYGYRDDGERAGADFDRWLAAHDREVAAKAWDEGRLAEARAWGHIFDGHPVAEGEMCDECMVRNPYREGGTS